jgi:hypothetical protein
VTHFAWIESVIVMNTILLLNSSSSFRSISSQTTAVCVFFCLTFQLWFLTVYTQYSTGKCTYVLSHGKTYIYERILRKLMRTTLFYILDIFSTVNCSMVIFARNQNAYKAHFLVVVSQNHLPCKQLYNFHEVL